MSKKEKKEKKQETIEMRDIGEELKDSYLDYAMSIIISRALPDARDGLKPVQRRILFAMKEIGLTSGAKSRKSASVVGEVLGKYHPHGDVAVYDALVRMAQDFSLRYPLIKGQGNFGSVDGDPPAAMRYTEAKLTPLAEEILEDLDKETVDFSPNYDGTRQEPNYLPAKIPQLILNGVMGIAVGMATNIPPHNLREITEAIIYLLDKPNASVGDLMQFIQGPDFPTGGIIFGKQNILEAYANGKGTIVCRAKAEIIEEKERKIIINEIPYLVNKAELIAQIANLVEEKRIEGIKDLRDESDKDGLRIVIELKSNAIPKSILHQLFKFTALEKNFHFNMLALTENGLQPQVLSIKDILEEYINHRKIIIRRRVEYLLKKAKERAHILEGLAKALSHIDEIIKLIKSSENKEEAQKKLMAKYHFSELQAEAILEMKLQSLAKLERNKIEEELAEKNKLIKEYLLILKEPKKIVEIIKKEVQELKEKFGDERRTQIQAHLPEAIADEELIPSQETLISFSKNGYIKRISPSSFKGQKRGGKGVIGYEAKNEEDIITHLVSCNTRDQILFFTDQGRLFSLRAIEIAEASRTSRGKTIQNYISLGPQEQVVVLFNCPADMKSQSSYYLFMATEKGMIKKSLLKEYQNIRRSGIIALKLAKDDKLIGAALISKGGEIILTSQKGQSIRFSEKEARAMKRSASGVIGMKISLDDKVVSLIPIELKEQKNKQQIIVISENGFGKKTNLGEYRKQKRGGRGIKTIKITAKTGNLVKSRLALDEEFLVAVSQKGQVIKAPLQSIPVLGRSTQGVRIMKLESGDKIASITLL
ncbi:MAG: DNA gyrase subunit A [Candidatus Pacebacteria bacterium]|nr:DNA gyrase subunit A [Candidatus Paceibacterota bacterium]